MMNKTKGYNALDHLFEQCNQKTAEFQKQLLINEENRIKLSILIKKIENNKFDTEKEKGDALESLTRETLKALKFFNALSNIHTSTNEIDFICQLSQQGHVAKANGFVQFENDFLIECKNYSQPINVTYVGKFASLLMSQNKKFGILVSKKGMTGSGWTAAYGWTKKLYLKNDLLIVSFTLNDFKKLIDNMSFFEIIEQKKMDIVNDTNISSYLKKHPAMKE